MSSTGFTSALRSAALVEAPVNKFMFDVALQGSNIASFAVSFVAAAFLLLAAHLAGRLTRQVKGEYRAKLYVSNILLAAVIMLALFVALTILTIARAEFSAAALTTGVEGLFSLGQKVASEGLLRPFINALGDTSALVLLDIQHAGRSGSLPRGVRHTRLGQGF